MIFPMGKSFIPSGNLLHSHGKSPCLVGQLSISMAIFKSYVRLPEGQRVPHIPRIEIPSGKQPHNHRNTKTSGKMMFFHGIQWELPSGKR